MTYLSFHSITKKYISTFEIHLSNLETKPHKKNAKLPSLWKILKPRNPSQNLVSSTIDNHQSLASVTPSLPPMSHLNTSVSIPVRHRLLCPTSATLMRGEMKKIQRWWRTMAHHGCAAKGDGIHRKKSLIIDISPSIVYSNFNTGREISKQKNKSNESSSSPR